MARGSEIAHAENGVVMRGIRLAILVLSVGSLAAGATLERLTLEDMIQKSTAIVRGRVTGSYGALRGSVIYTHYTVQVTERWKGSQASVLDVVVPGGIAQGLRQTFSGAPKLSAGGEYVFFLWTGSSGLTNIIGLSQGVFDLKQAGKDFVASRPASAEAMLDASGRFVRDEAVQFRLTALRNRITTTLARSARK
jgi:hypothetical protein